MPKRIDLTGRRFGRYTVVYLARIAKGHSVYLCRCDCGIEKEVSATHLSGGETKSCGCLAKDLLTQRNARHTQNSIGRVNGNKRPEYIAWTNMKDRCYNAQCDSYPNYGGRGITVCNRWRDSFENFLTDMGDRPSHMPTIERNDFNGNYEPSNCRWANWIDQGNNRRSNVILTYNGESMTMSQWIRKLGFKKSTIKARLRNGWTVDRALSTPPLK